VPLLTARAAAVTRPGGTPRVAGRRHGLGGPHFRRTHALIGDDRPLTLPPTPVFVLSGRLFARVALSRRPVSVVGHAVSIAGHPRPLIDALCPLLNTRGR